MILAIQNSFSCCHFGASLIEINPHAIPNVGQTYSKHSALLLVKQLTRLKLRHCLKYEKVEDEITQCWGV